MSLPVPPGIDWELWRVFSAGKWAIPSIAYMLEHWTLEDLVDAWLVLELDDDLNALEQEEAEKAQQKQGE